MMKQTDNLFECSPLHDGFLPSTRDGDAAKAPPCLTQNCCADGSLRNAGPEEYGELVRCYGDLLDKAVSQRVYRDKRLSAEVGDLSERLRHLRAGARDVVELHARVLDDKLVSVPQRLIRPYAEEGRFLVLELMGRLLSDYRTAFLQATQRSRRGSSSHAPERAHGENQE